MAARIRQVWAISRASAGALVEEETIQPIRTAHGSARCARFAQMRQRDVSLAIAVSRLVQQSLGVRREPRQTPTASMPVISSTAASVMNFTPAAGWGEEFAPSLQADADSGVRRQRSSNRSFLLRVDKTKPLDVGVSEKSIVTPSAEAALSRQEQRQIAKGEGLLAFDGAGLTPNSADMPEQPRARQAGSGHGRATIESEKAADEFLALA